MGNLARKFIDAIQHSMLGSLLFRLLWPWGWMVWILSDRLDPDGLVQALTGPFFILLLCSAFLIWLLGAFANRRRRPGPALQKLQDSQANGFDAWSELPAGGLRPPPWIRWLVTALGEAPGHRLSWLSLVTTSVALVLAFSLFVADSGLWRGVHPMLGDPGNRLTLALVCIVVLAAFVVRGWASDQRKLLELPADSSS